MTLWQLIARHGGGSFRDSISLLDQLANTTDHVTRETVESIIGLVPQEQLDALADAIIHRKSAAVIELLDDIIDGDSTAIVLTDQLVEALSAERPCPARLVSADRPVTRCPARPSATSSNLPLFWRLHPQSIRLKPLPRVRRPPKSLLPHLNSP